MKTKKKKDLNHQMIEIANKLSEQDLDALLDTLCVLLISQVNKVAIENDMDLSTKIDIASFSRNITLSGQKQEYIN